jgi:hypothetical protein
MGIARHTPAVLLPALLALTCAVKAAWGQSWTLTSAPATNWVSVACSADGHKIVAAAGGAPFSGVVGPIYISTNAGSTWIASTAPIKAWASVASSADGQELIAADSEGALYMSTNGGALWASNEQSPVIIGNWKSLGCSGDGSTIIAGSAWLAGEAYGGQISISTNSGATWNTTFSQGLLTCVACSADGRTMAVGLDAANPAPLTISTNSGLNWQAAPLGAVYAIACSGDGTRMVANNWRSSQIAVSVDSGKSWQSATNAGVAGDAVAVSADGSTMVATPNPGSIFVSHDSGANWTTNASPVAGWASVAASADGNTLVAVVNGGGIYTWHAPPPPGTVLWTYDAGSTIASSPALGPDGTVYVGTAGTLYAIRNQGPIASAKWTSGIPYVCSSPAVAADGTVYISAMDSGTPASGYLYALSSNGATNWTFYSQGNGSPAIGFDNTVYVTGGAHLYALTPDGTQKWNVVIGGNVTFGTPALAPDGTIYIASPEAGSFSALSPAGGLKWSKPAYLGPAESPAIGVDGTVYLVGSGLFAYRADGSSPWSLQGPLYAAPALGNDGTIYVAGSTAFGFEYGLSLNAFFPNGSLRWQVQTNLGGGPQLAQQIGTPAVDAGGNVYVAALNTAFAFSPEGVVRWAYTPGDGAPSMTSLALGGDGTIYATFGSKLYAIAGANTPGNSTWPMYHQNVRHTGKLEKPVLAQPQKSTGSNFTFQLYPNQLGVTYTVEASTNLSTWTPVTNIFATTLPTVVMDLSSSNSPTRFYRASAIQ